MTSWLEHPPRHNSASLTRDTVEGARKRARVMALEIARQSVGGTGKAIRTWAIARYYVDVRDVSSIILIAEITVASMAPTALSCYSTPSFSYPCLKTRMSEFFHIHFYAEFVIIFNHIFNQNYMQCWRIFILTIYTSHRCNYF